MYLPRGLRGQCPLGHMPGPGFLVVDSEERDEVQSLERRLQEAIPRRLAQVVVRQELRLILRRELRDLVLQRRTERDVPNPRPAHPLVHVLHALAGQVIIPHVQHHQERLERQRREASEELQSLGRELQIPESQPLVEVRPTTLHQLDVLRHTLRLRRGPEAIQGPRDDHQITQSHLERQRVKIGSRVEGIALVVELTERLHHQSEGVRIAGDLVETELVPLRVAGMQGFEVDERHVCVGELAGAFGLADAVETGVGQGYGGEGCAMVCIGRRTSGEDAETGGLPTARQADETDLHEDHLSEVVSPPASTIPPLLGWQCDL